jgi:hypothetical protein
VLVTASVIVLASIPKSHVYILDDLTDPSFYSRTAQERLADEALAHVPRHSASVAATTALVPHLSERSVIYFNAVDTPTTEYVVYQTRGPSLTVRSNPLAATELAREIQLVESRRSGYETVFQNRSFRVLRLVGSASAYSARR